MDMLFLHKLSNSLLQTQAAISYSLNIPLVVYLYTFLYRTTVQYDTVDQIMNCSLLPVLFCVSDISISILNTSPYSSQYEH